MTVNKIDPDLANSTDASVNQLIEDYIELRDSNIPRCNCNPHGSRCISIACQESGIYTKMDHKILTIESVIDSFNLNADSILSKITSIKSAILVNNENQDLYDDIQRLSMVLIEISYFVVLLKIDNA